MNNINNKAQYLKLFFVLNKKKIQKIISGNDFLIALIVCLAVIGVTIGIGLSSDNIVTLFSKYNYLYHSKDPLRLLSNWDGPRYIYIAKHGYRSVFDSNFFPLYPLLIRFLHYLINSYLLCALFISWMSMIGATYFFIKIGRLLNWIKKPSEAAASLIPFVLFPTAIFLVATYTEPLLAVIALSSIYFSLKKQWLAILPLVFLCPLSHITGLFVIIFDALILWEEKVHPAKILATITCGSAGLIPFMIYLQEKFHNPLSFVTAQEEYHGWLGHKYLLFIQDSGFFNILCVVLIIVTAIYFWKIRKSFSIYSLLFLLIPIVGGQWGGFNRYVLMAFPVQYMLFLVAKKHKHILIPGLILMTVFWAYTAMIYMEGYIGS